MTDEIYRQRRNKLEKDFNGRESLDSFNVHVDDNQIGGDFNVFSSKQDKVDKVKKAGPSQ